MAERPPERDESIAALFARLIDDGERFARAQARLYRAELLSRVGEAKTALIMIVVALLLAHCAVIALVLGLLLMLRHPLGEVWATVVVVGVSLGAAALLVKIAIGKIGRITAIKDKPE